MWRAMASKFGNTRRHHLLPLNLSVATMWSRGAMTDLNKLIGAAAKTNQLNSAMAINDNGQIVATALFKGTGTRRAVLLTPISPVPSR